MASVMRMLAWCGMKTSRSSTRDPGAVQRLLGDLGHLEDRPAKDLLAAHPQ